MKTKQKSKKSVQKRVLTTLLFEVKGKSLKTTATHNSKTIIYTLLNVYKMLFDSVKTKKESKANFNAEFLRKLECDRRARDNNRCQNTCYDRYYKLLDFLYNEAMTTAQKKKYNTKLASFKVRNKVS